MSDIQPNLWTSADHALAYLAGADRIPHRTEGERALLKWLPERVNRFLDLGSGDGRLAALIRTVHPGAELVVLDFSVLMLQRLRERFAADPSVTILELLDVETQLEWIRDIGFADVDCSWKWMELALLVGTKPTG